MCLALAAKLIIRLVAAASWHLIDAQRCHAQCLPLVQRLPQGTRNRSDTNFSNDEAKFTTTTRRHDEDNYFGFRRAVVSLWCHGALHDANFNVTAVVNSSGTVLERYSYTPYGTPTYLDSSFGLRY